MKGSYFKRGCTCGEKCTCDNKWSFVIDVGKLYNLGKRKQLWRDNFDTREDAEVAAAILIEEIKRGKFHIETDMLFKEYAEAWLADYVKVTDPKPGTLRIRKYGINKFLSYFKKTKLKKITEEMYQAVLDDLKEKGLGRSTIENIHVTGRLLFGKAVDKKLLNNNPTTNAYILRKNNHIINEDEGDKPDAQDLPKFLEVEELIHFLDIALEKGLYMDTLIFYMLAYTGMRVGELAALKWSDIDFKHHTISINKTYYNPTNSTIDYILVRPKTKKSMRVITVDPVLIEMLEKHKKEQEEMISRLGDRYFRDRMKRLLRLAGLNEDLTPHSLRHTHTSLLAEARVSLEQIMDRLGHTDDQITKNVYLHVTQEMKKEASQKFGELMRSLR